MTQEHPKVLMHIECLRGTGELTLAARVAKSLASRGIEVVVASGNTRNFFDHCGESVRMAPLPTIRFDDKDAKDYLTDDGRKLSDAPDWVESRKDRLLQLFREEKPDLVLSCYWPFGNGQGVLDTEMTALADTAKADGTKVCVSIRDVIHADSAPFAGSGEATAGLINSKVDRVFVHGDPKLVPLTDHFDYVSALDPTKIRYTGYVCEPQHPNGVARDTIVITAGGGDYRPSSSELVEKAIRSIRHMDPAQLEGKTLHILVGKSFDPVEFERLQGVLHEEQKAWGPGVEAVIGRTMPLPEYQKMLEHCGLLIGQAGIGTVMDALSHHIPAVVVPIEEPNGHYHFDEQLVRARKLEGKGVLSVIRQRELQQPDGAETLADRASQAIGAVGRGAAGVVDCGGAEHTADAVCNELDMAPLPRLRPHDGHHEVHLHDGLKQKLA